jgi:hypothetical protein
MKQSNVIQIRLLAHLETKINKYNQYVSMKYLLNNGIYIDL